MDTAFRVCARTGQTLNGLLGWAWDGGDPAPLTHRQALAWEAWLEYDEYGRPDPPLWEWYAARDYAADHLTGKGKVDPKKGLYRPDRTPPKRTTRAERTAAEKAKVIGATAGKGVRKRTRHKDGTVTDDETGEVVT